MSHAIDKTEEQFAKINEMFEEFKLNTITKDEFLSGIEDKADKEEIANIVSSYNSPLCIQNWPSRLSQKSTSNQPGRNLTVQKNESGRSAGTKCVIHQSRR